MKISVFLPCLCQKQTFATSRCQGRWIWAPNTLGNYIRLFKTARRITRVKRGN